MNLETRVRALEKQIAQGERGETWQDRIDRFMRSFGTPLAAQGIRFEDVRAIAVGQWDAVTSPVLLASKHRERWELAAPEILQMLKRQHEHPENAD
jgi:hypothetical protein